MESTTAFVAYLKASFEDPDEKGTSSFIVDDSPSIALSTIGSWSTHDKLSEPCEILRRHSGLAEVPELSTSRSFLLRVLEARLEGGDERGCRIVKLLVIIVGTVTSHWGAYITGIGSISQAPRHCYLLLEGLRIT